MSTLVFGAGGFLGQKFLKSFAAIGSRVDIADRVAVRQELKDVQPTVVINCAGKTGRPNIDWCETHPQQTIRSNVTGALVLAEECLARGIFLVHLSSGCLYSGDNGGTGFTEDDPPNFHNSLYVRSKISAEMALKRLPILILRPRMIFDGTWNERNLIVKLAAYSRVLDETNSMTYVPELISVTKKLVQERRTGIFNVVNSGTSTPFEIMRQFKRIVKPEHEFALLESGQLSEVACTGRSSCVLSTAKLRSLGLQLSDLAIVLRRALHSMRTSVELRTRRIRCARADSTAVVSQ